jgi:hypothetical protein
MQTTSTTATFQPGTTYYARSICDHNCITAMTVASRTTKSITTTEGKRLFVKVYQGEEQVWPDGHYSMALIIGANDTKVLRPDWEQARQTVEIPAVPMLTLIQGGA